MIKGLTTSDGFQEQEFPSYVTGTLDESSNSPSYFTGPEAPVMTSEVAAKRADRYDFALGEQSPGEQKLYQETLDGEEELFRTERSLEARSQLALRRSELARNFIQNTPAGEITQEDISLLQNIDRDEVDLAYSDPETYYERLYARKASMKKVEDLVDNGEDPRDPASLVAREYNHLVVNQNTAQKFLEEAQANMDTRTWGQAAKEWIPFWRWLKLSSKFENETTEGGFWLGTNMRDQIQSLWRLPPNEFYKESKKILDDLRDSDPGLALSYASALVGYSASSEMFDDFTSAVDLTTFGFTPKGVLMTGKAAGLATTSSVSAVAFGGLRHLSNLKLLAARNRMQHMIKNGGTLDYKNMLPHYQQAHAAAFSSLRAKAANTNQVQDLEALFGVVQDLHNPQSVLKGAQNMTVEEAARIEIGLLKTSTHAAEHLINRPRYLNRLSQQEVALATSEAVQFVERLYAKSSLSSRLIKVKAANIDQGETLSNTDAIKVYLGNAQGAGYTTAGGAKTQATKLGIPKYGIEEIDGLHYISMVHFVDETTTTLRSFAKSPRFDIKTRAPYLHPFTSRMRAKDNLIPEQQTEDLLVAQSAVNGYFNANRNQFVDDFSKLNGKQKQRMDEFLERERDYRFQDGPPDTVIRGRYAENVGEFQNRWMKEFDSLPSVEEIQTYFAWKNWNDIDYAIRNLDLTRDKTRLGIMNHVLKYRLPGSNAWENTPKLEGKILHEFPWDREGDAGILVWDSAESHLMVHPESYKIPGVDYKATKPPRGIYRKQYIRDFEKEHIDNLIQRDGYKVVHLAPHSKQDLADYMGSWGGKGSGPDADPQLIPDRPDVDMTATISPELRNKYNEGKATPEERRLYRDQAQAEKNKFDELYLQSKGPSKQFYRLAATDNVFRDNFHNVEDPLEQLNTVVDYYLPRDGGLDKGTPAGNPDLDKIISYAYNKRKDGIKPLTQSDLNKLNAQLSDTSRIYSPEQIKLHGEELRTARLGKGITEETPESNTEFRHAMSNLDKDLTNEFEVIGVGSDESLVIFMSDPSVVSKKTSARGSAFKKQTPYYILGPRGGDVTDATNIVLSGTGKKNKKRIQELFPEANVMTVNQAITWMKTGKAPAKPIAQRADEAVEAAQGVDGVSVGDEVIVLTSEDKKELAKTGSIANADKAQKHKVTGVLNDPDRPDLGSYLQVEGSSTGFPASDVFIVNKGSAVADSPTQAKYERGLDIGRYDYILVRPEADMTSTSLDFINFPRTEGGHMVNEDPWHIRQAQIYETVEARSRVSTYEGDVNAYTAVIEDDARAMATHLENMRAVLREDLQNGTNRAEGIYQQFLDGTSKDFKTFKKQFKEFHKQGKLRLDRPFVVTAKDRSSYDAVKSMIDADGNPQFPALQNHRDSPHNLYYNELNLQYALERSDGLERIARKGTAQNPVLTSDSGGNLSPMATMINSQNELLRNRMLSDLKIKNAENFAKYFGDVVDAPIDEVRRDPMEYILNPRWKQGLQGNDLRLQNAAKDYRRALIDFLGVDNPTGQTMKLLQAQVAEGLKRSLGQGAYEHIDRHLMRGRHISPVRWANTMVYDLFFGVFNLKQLLVQSMTSFHTAAVLGPTTGLRAGTAAHFARWVLFDLAEDRLDHLAGMMQKSKVMNADHFKEAVKAYRQSGFHIIGQETSFEDDFLNQTIKRSGFETGRDYARVFFKEGDRFSRSTAYIGAYMEWRKLNPKATMNVRAQNEILARANTLSLSMTGATQAAMAKGIGNIPLKFTTYHFRMMEQLMPGWTGSRLTPKERMRAYAMYSVAFGVPVTASGAFGVWPFHKEVSQMLIENGYDTDENLVAKAFNDGLAEALPSLLGVDQTFSETLGPSGTTWLYDIVNGRTPIFDLLTGVGGTKFYDVIAESWPFFTLMANAFRGTEEQYPLSLADWEDWARSVSSINNYWRAYQMYNTGVYMTKNRTPLMRGMDTGDILSNLFAGTQPKAVQKAFTMSDMTRATQEMKKEASRDIIKWHRLQMQAILDDDLDAFEEFGKKIKKTIEQSGFMPNEYNRLFTDVVAKNKDLVTLTENKFYSSTPERQKAFRDRMQNKHFLNKEDE